MRSDNGTKRDIGWDNTMRPLASLPPDPRRFWRHSTKKSWRGVQNFALVLAAGGLIASGPLPALSQAVQIVEVDVKAVAQGYRASKLLKTNVINDKNEKIGDMDDIIIGHDKKALFAVIEVGGFLGIGGQLVAVPFENLVFDASGKITLPGASKEALKKLPVFKYAS